MPLACPTPQSGDIRLPTALGFFELIFDHLSLVLHPSCRISNGLAEAEFEVGISPRGYRQIPDWVEVAAVLGGALVLAASRRRR